MYVLPSMMLEYDHHQGLLTLTLFSILTRNIAKNRKANSKNKITIQ